MLLVSWRLRGARRRARDCSYFLFGSREKTMLPSALVVEPDDLATRVDPLGEGVKGARDVDGREHAPLIEKAMPPAGFTNLCIVTFEVVPYDLAARVDPVGIGAKEARDMDGREHSLVIE